MIEAILKGTKKIRKDLEKEAARDEKALNIALKVEGFSLMKQMRLEIHRGAPGGRPFVPISRIAARTMASRLWGSSEITKFGAVGTTAAAKKRPLRRLGNMVRYSLRRGRQFSVAVGFPADRLSKSWVRIARVQQEGGTFTVSEKTRRNIRQVGIILKKRREPEWRYFFLQKKTRRFRVPARPIVDPFWRKHREDAWISIRKNFRRKVAGQRI